MSLFGCSIFPSLLIPSCWSSFISVNILIGFLCLCYWLEVLIYRPLMLISSSLCLRVVFGFGNLIIQSKLPVMVRLFMFNMLYKVHINFVHVTSSRFVFEDIILLEVLNVAIPPYNTCVCSWVIIFRILLLATNIISCC